MAVLARVLVVSFLTAGAGAFIGWVLFGQHSDATGVCLFLGCVGALIGAIAAAAHEITTALRQKAPD
jgi:hypothetical protein